MNSHLMTTGQLSIFISNEQVANLMKNQRNPNQMCHHFGRVCDHWRPSSLSDDAPDYIIKFTGEEKNANKR